jgi:hypothetical protein
MKKISVDTVRAFLKEKEADRAACAEVCMELADGTEVKVTLRTELSTAEKSVFISRVLSGCFDERGEFRPEYVTPMLRATILQMCSDLPAISPRGKSGELDIDAMNALYEALDLDCLDDADYRMMVRELVALCHEAIEWRKARELNSAGSAAKNAADAARELMGVLTEKVGSLDVDALAESAAKLAKTTDGLESDALRDAFVKAGLEVVK